MLFRSTYKASVMSATSPCFINFLVSTIVFRVIDFYYGPTPAYGSSNLHPDPWLLFMIHLKVTHFRILTTWKKSVIGPYHIGPCSILVKDRTLWVWLCTKKYIFAKKCKEKSIWVMLQKWLQRKGPETWISSLQKDIFLGGKLRKL